jgi:hypothetical protein
MFGKQLVVKAYLDANDNVVDGEVVNEGREAGWNPFAWWGAMFSGVRFVQREPIIDAEAQETCNIKGHEDYQYQVNYDPSNNGYWDGHG